MDWIAPLIALTCMEVVLGIDNIIFIAILASRLPEAQQAKARTLGLAAALITRLLLLSLISFLVHAEDPLFKLTDLGVPEAWLPEVTMPAEPAIAAAADAADAAVVEGETVAVETAETSGGHASRPNNPNEISIRDLVLILGGAFLIFKSVREVHHKVEGAESHEDPHAKKATFASVIVQIMILDVVFSLDSVITAVGMADELWVMMTAVVIAVAFMLLAAGPISRFVEAHPTIKILALSFLILIGFTLTIDGFGVHVSKGYIYFAMVFALGVELVNMKVRKRIKPDLKQTPPGTVDAVTG